MGRGNEQTLLQRRYTDGKQANEKMFNITNHQGNVNQNYTKISLYTHQNDYNHQDKKTTNVGEVVEKQEHLYTAGGNANWCSLYEKQYGESSKN